MTVSISNMSQVWMSNTNTYNGIAMSISTMGYGANANSRLLRFKVDGNTKFDIDANGNIVTCNNITSNSIVSNVITANTITINNIAINALTTNSITSNVISSNVISMNTITVNVVTSNTITTNRLTSNIVSSNTVSDIKGDLRDLPINTKGVSYILTANDSGKILSTNSSITIPNAVFSAGHAISIYNNSSSTIGISNAFGVLMQLAGQSNNQNKLLAQYGVATIICVSANTFVLSGAGLS